MTDPARGVTPGLVYLREWMGSERTRGGIYAILERHSTAEKHSCPLQWREGTPQSQDDSLFFSPLPGYRRPETRSDDPP